MRRFLVAVTAAIAVSAASCRTSEKPSAPQLSAEPSARATAHVLDAPLTALDGRTVRLRDVVGKATVISLWGSFCEPCLKELPYLDALHQSYANDVNVRVIAIGLDGPVEAKRVVSELGLSMPVYLDTEKRVARFLADPQAQPKPPDEDDGTFSIPALPLTAYLNPSLGVARSFGFTPGESKETYVSTQRSLVTRALQGRLSDADFAEQK
jgi:thiol-disulfide isomerase/thioredoxin